MKIVFLNSTLSCILKCLRFLKMMIDRKKFLGLIIVSFLTSCTSPTALIGPTYTLSSTGNAFQAGLNYGSNHMITKYTGKTPIENLKEMRKKEFQEINIERETLESEDFYILVKNKFEKTQKILNLPMQ